MSTAPRKGKNKGKVPPGNTNPVDGPTGVETTGHVWDGIEELNNPLPRWWLWSFYATIVWGIGYVIAYPAWPLVNGATAGLLGYSTRAEVAADIAAHDAANADINARLAVASLDDLRGDEDLYRYAVGSGAAVFRTNCSQCHGAGAAGAVGYPNLLDDDWLWGGTPQDIALTVRHGIRNDDDPDARWSQMPAFGEFLERSEIAELVEHVRALSGQDYDAGAASAGAVLFADNCAACHGDDGTGSRDLGAPNLADAIWLYGGDRVALTQTVAEARFGVMPPWSPRLTEAQIRAVATYVHQLGGGEEPVAEMALPDTVTAEPDAAEPDAAEPEAIETDGTETDATETDPVAPAAQTPVEDPAPADARSNDATTDDATSDDTAPDDTAPEDTAPEDTAPEDTAPEDTGPEDTGPEDTGPPEDSGAPDATGTDDPATGGGG